MSETGLVVPDSSNSSNLQGLTLSDAAKASQLKELTNDIMTMQVNKAHLVLQTGRKLIAIKTLLSSENPAYWDKWCESGFIWSKDYANRMIQVAEKFNEEMPGIEKLSFRHMREIARYSDNQIDLAELVKITSEQNTSIQVVRNLVSDHNRGTLNLDELIGADANLKQEYEKRVKTSHTDGLNEGRSRSEELKTRTRELGNDVDALRANVSNKEEENNILVNKLRLKDAAIIEGEGNAEVGELKITLQQTVQERDNLAVVVTQLEGDFNRVRTTHERWLHSPSGQAKLDFRKCMDDIQKVFTNSLMPVSLVARVSGLESEEAQAEFMMMLELVENWTKETRAAFATKDEPVTDE